MTDSDKTESALPTVARPDKRARLVSAATDLLYRQGVEKTTLADIAEAADVPLGNIYYYFKTKDAIVDAVVEAHVKGLEETLATLDRRYRNPKGRLKGLFGTLVDRYDVIAEFGCPHGTLCSELEKGTGHDDHGVTRLLEIPIAWAENNSEQWAETTLVISPSSSSPATKEPPCSPRCSDNRHSYPKKLAASSVGSTRSRPPNSLL